jgi:hypothetical protein
LRVSDPLLHRPLHASWLDHPNKIWRGKQIKIFITQFSPASWSFGPFRSKYYRREDKRFSS